MRLPVPWRRKHQIDPEATKRAKEHAAELARIADRVIASERALIRENHFGPKIAAALREEHR